MARRRSLSRRSSSKMFRKGAKRQHSRNRTSYFMRGGIRL